MSFVALTESKKSEKIQETSINLQAMLGVNQENVRREIKEFKDE